MSETNHQYFMQKAIDLSQEGMEKNLGGPFGCVIVKDGEIIAEGTNQVTSHNDPTMHSEIVAIRNACQKLKNFELRGCTLYCSCEPCSMCLSAIYWSRISKVYYANTKKDAAKIGFDDQFIYDEIDLAIEKRKLPMQQLMRKEALLAFSEWEAKDDKIEY